MACVAVKLCLIVADVAQIYKPVNRAQQVILRYMLLKQELIKQGGLRFLLRSHHRSIFRYLREIESVTDPQIKQSFQKNWPETLFGHHIGRRLEVLEMGGVLSITYS